jgi:NAD(P)-dependent dehydrogenase (short-subunit alcohol dehydrogenase family)
MSIHPAISPGNVAVVTGGASGIGLAAAQRFAALGMTVAIADWNKESLEKARQRLGGDVLAAVVDVSQRASVEQFAQTVAEQLGPVSVLMNNAGVGGGNGDVLAGAEAWDRILPVNLMGVLHVVQTFVPAMVESEQPGLVINTGSKQGITQPPGNTAYNVSKAGVKALTEGLAHTLRERTQGRVSAHLLVPGFTFTGMTSRSFTEKPDAAWTPDQVVDVMIDGIGKGSFYLWCLDNETTMDVDAKRILWNALDIIEDRPALSRWHPDYKQAFSDYVAGK